MKTKIQMQSKEIKMNTKTLEFIEKAKKVHGDRYGYDSVDYINNYTKVAIFCERHGIFMQIPNNHLGGSDCRKCAHTITTEEFIIKVNKVHNNKYSYLDTVFNGTKEKVEVTCNAHGNFTQKAQSHLRGVGCPKCANESISKKLMFTNEDFVEKAKEIHGDKYDYSEVEYKGTNTRVKLFCSKHGQFLQSPNSHLIGHGCMKCGKSNMSDKRTKTTEQFIQEANLVHNGKYSYNQSEYIKCTEKVDISCHIHGLFKQTPSNHIKGQGCPKCKHANNLGGFGKNEYIKRANGRICTFYTLRCFNKDEEFYKIGITMTTLKERYSNTKKMPYNYELISEVYGEAGFIWDLEISEKRRLKDFKYQPKIDFKGSKTECFTKYEL